MVLSSKKGMNKGYINYTLASMVYAEVVLRRKVDWSTYPRGALYGKKQKDIPSKLCIETQPTT